MGLSAALGTALSGLHFVQSSVDLVSRNVANAGTPGYTRKAQAPVTQLLGNSLSSIRAGQITRGVDTFLQQQIRTESGIASFLEVRDQFLSRIDQLFGRPGAANALDSVVNNFGQSLQDLTAAPDDFGTREQTIAEAQALARHLNSMSNDIQEMRRQAEARIADSVDQVNTALQQIASLNRQIAEFADSASGTADIADERDRFIDQLSGLLDISVAVSDNGVARVFTSNGNLLVGSQAAVLSFDEHAAIGPASLFSNDDSLRGVGTLVLQTVAGSQVDLFKGGSLRGGAIASLKEMRDTVLVQAQDQLDEFAHSLALSLSTKNVAGTPVAVGAQNGFDIDIAGLLAGNEIKLAYTQTPPGTQQNVTLIRVDDPATLPLGNDATADPDDTVIGIDFSGGLAGAAAAIDAALGASITVSSPAADTIRILDDGAAGTISIDSLNAAITSTALADDGEQLALFVDPNGAVVPYSNNPDGTDQKIGFAQRIAVNAAVVADNTALVVYSTSPPTGIGDPARPLALVERFSQQIFTFDPGTGIGSPGSPLTTSVSTFAQRIVSFQGQVVSSAAGALEAQTVVLGGLQSRFDTATKVDVDTEMAQLLVLQNAYAANARVITAVSELIEILRQI